LCDLHSFPTRRSSDLLINCFLAEYANTRADDNSMLLPPSPTNACVKFPVLRTNVWSPRPKDPKSMVTCLHAVSTTLRCPRVGRRSEEHTSELQSPDHL